MDAKKLDALASEWLAGDKSRRTSIQQKLKGSTALSALLDRIGEKLGQVKA